jgi:transcriptional regulator with XRE-family HTH domain
MKRNSLEYICGAVIKQQRELAGHKLLSFEKATGISKSKLSKIETGCQLLDMETLYRASIVLNISMSSIVAMIEEELFKNPPRNSHTEVEESKMDA